MRYLLVKEYSYEPSSIHGTTNSKEAAQMWMLAGCSENKVYDLEHVTGVSAFALKPLTVDDLEDYS